MYGMTDCVLLTLFLAECIDRVGPIFVMQYFVQLKGETSA